MLDAFLLRFAVEPVLVEAEVPLELVLILLVGRCWLEALTPVVAWDFGSVYLLIESLLSCLTVISCLNSIGIIWFSKVIPSTMSHSPTT